MFVTSFTREKVGIGRTDLTPTLSLARRGRIGGDFG
jgi:hypothetical protein